MLVPPSSPQSPPCPVGSDDVIATPGALTSGFSTSDTGVGPPEEKSAIMSFAVVAATVIAARCIRGRADRPVAELVEVVARRDHRYDACLRGRVDRVHDDVARRLDLGLAEREVDHVHPV